ncbi:hypothetical protein ACKI1J_42830 [Streptomyces scabiei]|uniref:hypothetical protein n=1 Tax=Streptomyces TaxID=1883 RepID=UPI0029A56FAB|nr:hypothetical protein [Streptomyces stelliscabiei]MDX2552585.1 hypothetical protein [Streptomyces stelliscabiei]
MSESELEPHAGGSVAHHWGNALARRWAPELPRPLTQGFLTCLYALRQLASADGQLKYARDGKGITLAEIAAACRSSQKDVRAFLTAAIAAGVVTTVGARRRGVAAVYCLLVSPRPNWAAAAAVVDNHRRGKTTTREPAEQPTSSDHSGPTSPAPSSDHSGPNSAAASSDHSGPSEFGPQWSRKFGPQWSHHPGITHELPHEDLSVGPQVRDARGHESHERAEESSTAGARPLRAVDGTRSGARRPARPSGQMPLLMTVPAPQGPPEPPADPGAGDHSIGAPPDGWRALVARERPDDAQAVYGDRWTGTHAHHLPGNTG